MLLNPQLVIIYNVSGDIESCYFLTYGNLDNESRIYKFYELLSNDNRMPHYKIIRAHVLLTFDVEQAKGYLREVLDIEDDIILFSLISNIEFFYEGDNSIFNPYEKLNTKYILKKRQSNDFLFQFYKESTDYMIFCISRDHPLGSPGIYNSNFKFYIDQICNNILQYNYNLSVKHERDTKIWCELSPSIIFSLMLNGNYTSYYTRNGLGYFYVSGDRLEYKPTTKHKEYWELYRENIRILTYQEYLQIENYEEWKKLNIDDKIDKRSEIPEFKVTVSFDTRYKFKLEVDRNDINFIVLKTRNTKNMYRDVSNSIGIMTASTHIVFRSDVDYGNFPLYLTLIILGYSQIISNIIELKNMVKHENLYISKLCQDSKTVKRRPVITTKSFNPNNYEVMTNNFFKGKEKPIIQFTKTNEVIETTIRHGDIYVDDDGIYHKCTSKNTYLGFLENIYHRIGLCKPCCYGRPRYNTSIFKKCVFNIEPGVISPYIFGPSDSSQFKIILVDHKLGLLPKNYSKFFNSDSTLKLEDRDLIVSASDFVIYRTFPSYTRLIDSFDELVLFVDYYSKVTDRGCIMIVEKHSTGKIWYEFYLDKIYEDREYDVFVVIKHTLHILSAINKKPGEKIKMSPISNKITSKIIDVYKKKFDDKILEYEAGGNKILYNYNSLYINEKRLESSYSHSLIRYNNPPSLQVPYDISRIDSNDIRMHVMIRNLNSYNS